MPCFTQFRETQTCACAMPVPPWVSHSVMDSNLTSPGNLGESSSWAESQALEVRGRPIYIFYGICYTSDGWLPAVSPICRWTPSKLERFGLLESVRRRFKEEKVNWMCTWDYKWFCEQIHIAFKSQDYKCDSMWHLRSCGMLGGFM